jgi:thioredoxin reductase (NADPH)
LQAKSASLYQIVIIGGGPIGLACAIEAKKAGLSYVVLEKGCLVNSLYNYPVNMTFFSTSEKLEIDNIPFVSNNSKPTRSEALEYYRRVATSRQLNIKLQENVETIQKDGEQYRVISSHGNYYAKYVIVATGFYDLPVLMGVPGENLPKVSHYYKDPHFYAMQKVLVVGASNSAVDAALETYRKGAEVTMVVRAPEISHRVKYWVKPDIENRIAEKSIKAFFNSSVSHIRENSVDIQTPDGIVTVENDFVIALTGYRPSFEWLAKAGIELSDDDKLIPSHDAESMETNLENVFLAGVVCGGMDTHLWFIENSRIHAEKIVLHIVKKESGVKDAPSAQQLIG